MSKIMRVGDEGQRYVVEGTLDGKKMELAYCQTMESVYETLKAIFMHPGMIKPTVIDRETGEFENPDECNQCIYYLRELDDCMKHHTPMCQHDPPTLCNDGIMANLHRSD